MRPFIQAKIDAAVAAATAPLQEGLEVVATNTGLNLAPPNPAGASTPAVPSVQQRIDAAVGAGLDELSGVSRYLEVAGTRTSMRNEALRQRLIAVQQQVDSQDAVNAAQEALLRELVEGEGKTSARLGELSARLDLVKAQGQNLATDLAANQAHDVLQDARLASAESRLAADALAIVALQAENQHEDAAIATLQMADQAQAAQLAATTATATLASAKADAEHGTNVAQQSQLDSQAAQQALLAARQTGDEQLIAQAQATATQALQKAAEDAQAAQQAQAAANAAQVTATSAQQAAATAQASANAAQARADLAEADAQLAKAAASAAQTKANEASAAAAAAQATATAAQQAAATNAAALTALQAVVAGKLDSSLVRRGSVVLPLVTIAVATPATVQVVFVTPLVSANYEVFLSKPGAGLLGVELGWATKTAAGFTLTERNTGLASLAVPASSADYFAILN